MNTADFIVIGGGIAGVSAAARLARHGRVVLLEAESAFGYHSSGRSATFSHLGIGNAPVRGLTTFSRPFLDERTPGGVALSHPHPAMFIASAAMIETLGELEAQMRSFTNHIERIDQVQIRELVPVVRCGEDAIVAGLLDNSARRIDSEALQQNFRSEVKARGGACVIGARIIGMAHDMQGWALDTAAGDRFVAPIVINAAGAWCDQIAGLAGVRPLGLEPLRRTIIAVDAPAEYQTRRWPFTKTARDDFYMLPQSGTLLASPVDEVPSPATDAQPEDYDIALAAAKLEQYTSIEVKRIRHSWAGLRSFTADRVPVAGFAEDAKGFFWLAGQGGYGLQTAPAMAAITEAIVTGGEWPEELRNLGVVPETMMPGRLALSAA